MFKIAFYVNSYEVISVHYSLKQYRNIYFEFAMQSGPLWAALFNSKESTGETNNFNDVPVLFICISNVDSVPGSKN